MNLSDDRKSSYALRLVAQFSGRENVIPISRFYVSMTGDYVTAAVLSQLLYWWSKTDGEPFYKTDAELGEELCLSPYQLNRARATLKRFGVSTERRGIPAKTWYTIDEAVLEAAIRSHAEQRSATCSEGPSELVIKKLDNWSLRNSVTSDQASGELLQETTTETTTETTAENTEERKDTPLSAKADIPPRGKCDVPSEPCLLTIEPDSDAKGKPNGKYPARFEQFWQAYRALGCTRPHNKAESLKAYQRALTRAEHEVIMDGLERYAVHLDEREAIGHHDARDYIPMPQTWLNQARWDTEYPAQQARVVIGNGRKALPPGTRQETMVEAYRRLTGSV